MKTIVYQKNYEEITAGTITYSVHYVYSPDELVAMIVKYDSANVSYEKVYGVVTNHQGSIMALYDTQGKIVWETSYDAWGRERSIAGVSYTSAAARPPWLIRGYTGHEHLAEFGLINMNGRMYDPQIGRMLSPDNFVQDATSTQGYNRYSYVLNNPLRYRDPSGEFIFTLATLIAAPLTGGASLAFLPAAIGADLGMWQGGYLANGTMNPFKWDYSSGKTWAYMGAGALVGAASGYIGGQVAAAGGVFANTSALVVSSTLNSMGTAAYTGFQTDVSMNFGIGSFNLSKGELTGIWNWGELSTTEKIGYSLGTLANVSDIYQIYSNNKSILNSKLKGSKPSGAPERIDPELAYKVLGTKKGTYYYGPSKTGWDPEFIKNNYGLVPKDPIDIAAFNHDVVHYNRGTEGLIGSLLSTDRATFISDIKLWTDSFNALRTGTNFPMTAIKTIIGFGLLNTVHFAEMNAYLTIPYLLKLK